MNARPHGHEVELEPSSGIWVLTYGDTQRYFKSQELDPTEDEIRAQFEKAKEDHDRESKKAGVRQAICAKLTRESYENPGPVWKGGEFGAPEESIYEIKLHGWGR